MTTALELLQSYQDNIQDPATAAALFAQDGVLELPTAKAHAQGHAAIEKLISSLLVKIPDFRFKNFKVWIETPDKVFGEYSVDALVVDTGKLYRQTYAGVLIAEDGKIKLLREALDTAAAAWAFSKS